MRVVLVEDGGVQAFIVNAIVRQKGALLSSGKPELGDIRLAPIFSVSRS
jgi:hypothetical protein